MKKIEHGMVTAVNVGVSWRRSNTEVVSEFGRRIKVYLFGNCIMKQSYNGVRYYSCAGWNTATTRSRLRALGCNVSCRGGILYRDGREWMEDPDFDYVV
jgi:hypothetical protein